MKTEITRTLIHDSLDIALQQENEKSYKRAIKDISLLIESMRETSDSIKIHDETVYIIGASQALMVAFDKNPDIVERDIRMAVRALELEEE